MSLDDMWLENGKKLILVVRAVLKGIDKMFIVLLFLSAEK